MMERRPGTAPTTSLVDILDRVLDKGLVVAGDIRVSLANVELLTIRIRLLVCSIDKAEEIGMDWWRHDSFFSSGAINDSEATAALRSRVEALESSLLPPVGRSTVPNAGVTRRRQPRKGS
jgi:hypothetical protein